MLDNSTIRTQARDAAKMIQQVTALIKDENSHLTEQELKDVLATDSMLNNAWREFYSLTANYITRLSYAVCKSGKFQPSDFESGIYEVITKRLIGTEVFDNWDVFAWIKNIPLKETKRERIKFLLTFTVSGFTERKDLRSTAEVNEVLARLHSIDEAAEAGVEIASVEDDLGAENWRKVFSFLSNEQYALVTGMHGLGTDRVDSIPVLAKKLAISDRKAHHEINKAYKSIKVNPDALEALGRAA